MARPVTPRRILGINFAIGSLDAVVQAGLNAGLVVIPSAPVLARMPEDQAHLNALLGSDMAVADSGFMVLIWWFIGREKLQRVSGLKYLERLLNRSEIRERGSVVWIMPSRGALERNLQWLRSTGHATNTEDCWIAEIYPRSGEISDPSLLDWVRQRRPRHIVIALGGTVQERLGWFLKKKIQYPVGIHCVGAAIGFLSGDQVHIPTWADRIFLGWLWRCGSAPAQFIPRYAKAIRLLLLLVRYRESAPAGKAMGRA